MPLSDVIRDLRASTVAIMSYRQIKPARRKGGRDVPAEYRIGFGSGFCVVADRYIVTAHHVLNGGKPHDPADKFLAFVVPENQSQAFHFPVVAVTRERADCDIAILELGACATPGARLPAFPVTLVAPVDGSRVVTVGFPSPEVHQVTIDAQGTYLGGQFLLKSHANEGLVAAQYDNGPLRLIEFNVEWHHGESGGAVVRQDGPVAAFSLMQHYRSVQGPNGVLPGPRRGYQLSSVEAELRAIGANIV